jgi:NosR/NirI family transcriptional regulator, nitrous oxide reductase regulator
MRRGVLIAVAMAWVCALPSAAYCQQRFPPPEFDTPYKLPPTPVPTPAADWAQYVDMAMGVAALAAASFLSLRARSRALIVALGVFSLLYFGFYRGGCVCPVGSVQNVAKALLGSGYVVPLSVLGFFLMPLLTALFFGRSFCASVCPLGQAQDLVVLKPLAVPNWLEQSLGMLAWVYLSAAVVLAATDSAMIVCQYDPFVSIFRLVPVGKLLEGWGRRDPALNPAALSGRWDTLLLAGGMLAIGVVVARPYCRYLCPYGVLLGLMSKLSWRRVTITPDECIRCRLCEGSCPFGAIRKPTPPAPGHMRMRGRRALVAALAMLLPLVAAAGWLGGLLGPTMARLHPTVQLADRVRLENAGTVEGTTDASDAFRASGRSPNDLYAEAAAIVERFVALWRPGGLRVGSAHLFGALVGLVVGLKFVALSVRRRRVDYEADRTTCLACGRCFAYCPIEQARRKGTPMKLAPPGDVIRR